MWERSSVMALTMQEKQHVGREVALRGNSDLDPGTCWIVNGLQRLDEWPGQEHHPCASTEWDVIRRMVTVMGVIAKIDGLEVQNALVDCHLHDADLGERFVQLGKYGNRFDFHNSNSIADTPACQA